jgi:hypothetical protein
MFLQMASYGKNTESHYGRVLYCKKQISNMREHLTVFIKCIKRELCGEEEGQ